MVVGRRAEDVEGEGWKGGDGGTRGKGERLKWGEFKVKLF